MQKIKFSFEYYWTTGTVREDQYSAMITLSLIFVRTRNDSDRNCRCTKNAFYFQYIFFHKILHLMYQFGEIWCTSNSITRHMHSACRITKARIRTLRIGNIGFSSSTISTHSNERLHVRCPSCHTLTTHDTTPLRFMTHQKCNIAYGCCQLDSIFHWFPKLNTHPVCDGIIIESYKFLCKIC